MVKNDIHNFESFRGGSFKVERRDVAACSSVEQVLRVGASSIPTSARRETTRVNLTPFELGIRGASPFSGSCPRYSSEEILMPTLTYAHISYLCSKQGSNKKHTSETRYP